MQSTDGIVRDQSCWALNYIGNWESHYEKQSGESAASAFPGHSTSANDVSRYLPAG